VLTATDYGAKGEAILSTDRVRRDPMYRYVTQASDFPSAIGQSRPSLELEA
jgi:hypothetical protein